MKSFSNIVNHFRGLHEHREDSWQILIVHREKKEGERVEQHTLHP